MPRTPRPVASTTPPPSQGRGGRTPRVELVTLTVEDLDARYEDVAERTAARVSARYEHLIERLAERFEAAAAQSGHKEWLTTREAAAYCGLEYDTKRGECATLRRWREGGLAAEKGLRGWMYRPSDLDAFRARQGGTRRAPSVETGTDSGPSIA